jgi:hypothetical protein
MEMVGWARRLRCDDVNLSLDIQNFLQSESYQFNPLDEGARLNIRNPLVSTGQAVLDASPSILAHQILELFAMLVADGQPTDPIRPLLLVLLLSRVGIFSPHKLLGRRFA